MNKGISPPLGRARSASAIARSLKKCCATKKMVPFLSGADGEGRRGRNMKQCLTSPGRAAFSVALQGYAARPPLLEGGDMPLFMFGLPESTFA